jgi:hypothetical protein
MLMGDNKAEKRTNLENEREIVTMPGTPTMQYLLA